MGQFILRAIELKSVGDKDIVEGFISTTDPDLYKDVVNENAQNKILQQLTSRSIKLDLDHNKFRDPQTGEIYEQEKNMIPPGKIIDAELKQTPNGQKGVWVKVQLNKDHSEYTRIKNSIKNGFLDAFSIAYTVLKKLPHNTYRIIDDLIIRNVALTGDPVNRDARVALKSIPRNMEPQNNNESISQADFNELKSVHETIKAELNDLKSKQSDDQDYKSAYENLKADYDKMKSDYDQLAEKQNNSTDLKSLQDSNKKVEELKSQVQSKDDEIKSLSEKVQKYESEPQLKSFLDIKSKVEKELVGENNQINLWRMNQ